MAYYYEGRDKASFVEATIHHAEDCPELGGPVRPIAEESVKSLEDPDYCPDCSPLDSDSGSDSAPETCETVKADGEVCGRELPCPYHSE